MSNSLSLWFNWPGLANFFLQLEQFSIDSGSSNFMSESFLFGLLQFLIYFVPPIIIVLQIFGKPDKSLNWDAELFSELNTYIVRSFFWAVLLIGIVDMFLSFLRVEGILELFVGEELAKNIGRSRFRGANIHYPLIVIAFIIGYFSRGLGFIWLSALIVIAEMQIVIARFVFSYEQAFMADLVRFWYGALFLFASAYTLVKEGHVRVDVFYAGFSKRGKAWCNMLGSILFGVPLCWVILLQGMWGKSNVISGPMLNYEVTQAGYGMYVKYLLAGFLLVFAFTMLIQFMSYFLTNLAVLRDQVGSKQPNSENSSEMET